MRPASSSRSETAFTTTMARAGSQWQTARRSPPFQYGRDWIWIAGNHDRRPADGVGGGCAGAIAIDGLMFRHEPTGAAGEIAGHLHPVARVSRQGHMVSRRCFAADRTRLIMPAFGAFAGGLNVRHRAFADVFGTLAFTAHLLGEGRLYAIAASRCLRD